MNNNKPRHAKEIVSTALKIAKDINLPKAAIAVFDEEGEVLDIGTYGKSEEKAESDCRMKMNDLHNGKKLTEIGGFRDIFIKLLGKLVGKSNGVQGVVKVKNLGYVAAMCVFDSSKDVQVIHQAMMEREYVSEEGEVVWAPHKEFVFPEPGWTLYVKKMDA
ncbi:MAG: hypothetical protein GY943_26810 [Chloroflexi bacterium]|nr:hypothetical protein [Chloroflexota bacterium]